MLRTDVPVRVGNALPRGFEPEARVRSLWRTLPQVFRAQARGYKPISSASQRHASNTLRNSSYTHREAECEN